MNPTHAQNLQTLAEHSISLDLTSKKVKNINFRLKPHSLKVSAPWYASEVEVAYALNERLDWIIRAHQRLLDKQSDKLKYHANPEESLPLILWGKVHGDIQLNETQRLKTYRQQLTEVMPSLFDKWQPIVGKTAKEHRIKKMKTRWGSCNTRAKRVWLSVYLSEYPLECTEYVIVHELCHLHHADHSSKFWAEVRRAMPEYKQWHDMLAGRLTGKAGQVD